MLILALSSLFCLEMGTVLTLFSRYRPRWNDYAVSFYIMAALLGNLYVLVSIR